MSRFNEALFKDKFIKHTDGNYEYLGYENGLVKFLCKKHNIINYDTPSHLLSNRGCKLCGKERQRRLNELSNKKAKESFIKKAEIVHNGKYDYSKTEYKKSDEKVYIICPIHGEFQQTPNSHLRGNGCPKCGIEKRQLTQRKTYEDFVREAKEVHGDKYDYSKVEYKGYDTPVCIICPIHGEFWQRPGKHLIGHGCPECGIDKSSRNQSFTTQSFVQKAKEVHGDKYDYSKVEYKGYDVPICIICPIHGEFWQTPDSHLQGSGCQICSTRLSKDENELYNIIVDTIGKENVDKSNTSILPNHSEIDILIPNLKIGIEYDGCHWHTEQFGKDRYYHQKKTNVCERKGISLIHIFEDEYKDKKEIVVSKIKHILKAQKLEKIYGRKCEVEEIAFNDAKEFLDKNHIQGSQRASVYLGAKFKGKLIGVMTFIRIKDGFWELNRFASDINFQCDGVGGKLFSYFIKKYDPLYIKSFADKRWTINKDNNLYTKLGFKLKDVLKPDYRYVINGSYKRIHKFNFRKQILHKKYGFDLSMTESEMAKALNAYKIWDCGLLKYVWEK